MSGKIDFSFIAFFSSIENESISIDLVLYIYKYFSLSPTVSKMARKQSKFDPILTTKKIPSGIVYVYTFEWYIIHSYAFTFGVFFAATALV